MTATIEVWPDNMALQIGLFVLFVILVLYFYKRLYPNICTFRESDFVKIAALGRNVHIGGLYDCESDLFLENVCIPNFQLPNVNIEHPKSEIIRAVVKDTFLNRFKCLEMNSDQVVNFLSGSEKHNSDLVGSSEILNEPLQEGKVLFSQMLIARTENLSVRSLPVKIIETINEICPKASHMVVGIKYGGITFTTFDLDLGHAESVEAITSVLSSQTFDQTVLKDRSSTDFEEKNKILESFSCANDFYTHLHNFRGGSDRPLTVFLLPIRESTKSHKPSPFVDQLCNVYDMVKMFSSKAADALKRSRDDFTKQLIQRFVEGLENFKKDRLQPIARPMAKVFDTERFEKSLQEINNPPFDPASLSSCLKQIDKYSGLFAKAKQSLGQIQKLKGPEDLPFDPAFTKIVYIYCLSRNCHFPILDSMESRQDETFHEQWVTPSVLAESNKFKMFSDINSNSSEIKFSWYESNDESNGIHQVGFSDNGFFSFEPFIMPDAPRSFQVKYSKELPPDKGLILEWEEPGIGYHHVGEYEIILYNKESNELKRYKIDAKNTNFNCTDISSVDVHEATIRAICWGAQVPEFAKVNPLTNMLKMAKFEVNVSKWVVTPSTVEINFKNPKVAMGGVHLPITKYEVHIFGIDKRYIGSKIVSKPDFLTKYATIPVDVECHFTYYFTIKAFVGSEFLKWESPSPLKIDVPQIDIIKESLVRQSKYISGEYAGKYELDMTEIYCDDTDRLRWLELGESFQGKGEKTIMMVGATGAGKTTLINGLINYILGIEWQDRFRFCLAETSNEGNQAHSQTNYITAYSINHKDGYRYPYHLTIIDTPGFGDTGGIVRDKQITGQIKQFFTANDGSGIDSIHAICFVAQSSLPRLTITQKYIFEQILALFGKDIAKNIFMMLTFADASEPPVLCGIREAGIPFEDFFKFNNSALFSKSEACMPLALQNSNDNKSQFDEMFWRMGLNSFEAFLSKLGEC